jgi:DNA-binding NarL/FixJ family response regulator
MSPLRVVVAEDVLVVRAGIEALLATETGIEIVGSCCTYDELMTFVTRGGVDVVVTDIRMPPTGTDEGIRAAVELRRSHPEVAVVVLSQFLDPTYLVALIVGGTNRRGYLLKERVATAGELASAIRTVAEGGSFIDPAMVESLVAAPARNATARLRTLTNRERETLAGVAEGKSNAAIAVSMCVSERAVEKNISSIFTKLDLSEDPDTNRRVKSVLMFLYPPAD